MGWTTLESRLSLLHQALTGGINYSEILRTISPHFISRFTMFSIAAAFGNVHGVYKAGNVSLSPHLLKGHQEYAKQQQLKCDEDKVDFFVLE